MVSSVRIDVFKDKNEFSVTWKAGWGKGTLATLEKIESLLSQGLTYIEEPRNGSEGAPTHNSLSHTEKNVSPTNPQAELHKTVELIFSRYQSSWTALLDKIFSVIRKFLGWGPSTGEKIASAYENITRQLEAASSQISIKVSSLEGLPNALLKHIIGFLPAVQIAQCRCISKLFRDATYEDSPPAPEIQRAREYGYRGGILQGANAHTRMVLRGMKKFVKLKKNLKYNELIYFEELIKLIDCKKANGRLDCESTLRKLMFLPLSEQQKKLLQLFLLTMINDYRFTYTKKEEVAFVLLLCIQPDFFIRSYKYLSSPLLGSPLQCAADANNVELVKVLLAFGANPNLAHPETGNCSLTIAIRYVRGDCCSFAKEIAQLLIKAGANPNLVDKKGITPLLQAVASADLLTPLYKLQSRKMDIAEIVRKLLDAGANANIPTHYGNLPLHYAAELGLVETVRLLLSATADINAKGYKGRTALAFAAINRQNETVTLLLDKGADCHIPDSEGKIPFELAQEKGFHEVAALFRK